MGFAVGTEKEKQQERAVKGHYRKVAVSCWFTASGKSMPQLVKYEDDDGCIQVLRDIHILKTEQKYYAGILSKRYYCSAVVDNVNYEFTLLYHPDEGRWDLVLPD